MKKYILLICICFLGITYASVQQRINIYNAGQIMYQALTSDIDSVKFQSNSSIFNFADKKINIPISDIDSITFTTEEENINKQIIYILYNEKDISIINPLENNGVEITTENGNVSIISTSETENIEYHISGTISDGSLTISSAKNIIISLGNGAITNTTGSAINIIGDIVTNVNLLDNKTYSLSDGTSSTQSATLQSDGSLVFKGQGTLNVKGYKKHAISSAKLTTIDSGNIKISDTASDGFNTLGFKINNGNIDIESAGDAIDAGKGLVEINDGIIKINSFSNDVKGIKGNESITVNGGNIEMTVSGNQSKGISSKGNIVFNNGNISITVSGATVLSVLGSGYDTSYCTAVKSDADIIVNGGVINITAPSSNDGAKGFSADANITINNGNVTIKTAGNGATYTNETGVKDSYTASCIKSDVNIYLLGGTINCTSSGTGGKGISADGELIIGKSGESDSNLILNVTTSGERFYVSGSGQNADYANPKAIKSEGNLTVNSGTIIINCTQKDEGGEGLESKSILTINGGLLTINTYDDCINASNHIEITGGTTFCTSTGNDGIDSNGTLSVSGGFIIARGTRSPECGIDCDQSRFSVTGGIIIGTGGSTSNPTASACTQRSIVYSGTAGNAICIKNSAGQIIMLYQMPTYSSSSSGGGPGGGNSSYMTLLFTDPNLSTGTYTLLYGGTISGGTTVNGYNTGGTYSGGSSKSFTISSMVTTVR